jgi:hypothetical protein
MSAYVGSDICMEGQSKWWSYPKCKITEIMVSANISLSTNLSALVNLARWKRDI